MKKFIVIFVLAALFVGAFLTQKLLPHSSSKVPSPASTIAQQPRDEFIDSAIRPVPLDLKLNEDKVRLGEKLFHDPRLSKNNRISCASCHDLINAGGTISAAKAVGISGQFGSRNPPTVFNSATHFSLHWDGRFDTPQQQLEAPLLNPAEMGNDWQTLLARLRNDAEYAQRFMQLYPQQNISIASVTDAIATFERSLSTPNARFDQFLRGDIKALSKQEKEGYRLFSTLGCIACHQGVNIGGNLYQKIGTFKPYTPNSAGPAPDFGRFLVTGNEADKFVFKVPSLRNIAKTAPYLHDGSITTLEEVINIMAEYQLGRTLTKQEITDIAAFLNTLTGTYKGQPL